MTVNKNTVPFETRSPFVTSGIRIGTPAMTTRGMKEEDMQRIAAWMDKVLGSLDNESIQKEVCGEVEDFARAFPLFAW
jgi:glycine hydroxymethyltransferase